MIVVVQKEADGLKASSEVRSFMSAATNVDVRDPAGAIRAITASAIGAVTRVRNCSSCHLSNVCPNGIFGVLREKERHGQAYT